MIKMRYDVVLFLMAKLRKFGFWLGVVMMVIGLILMITIQSYISTTEHPGLYAISSGQETLASFAIFSMGFTMTLSLRK